MKKNENFKKGKGLVKSFKQAQFALHMLVQDHLIEDLVKGMFELLDKLSNPKLDELLDRYPDLLQEYELEHLLIGDIELPDARKEDIKTAGLLSCLYLILHFCKDLVESKNPTDDRFDSLWYIIKSITSYQFVNELLLLIISLVGEDYYENFQQKIQDIDFDFEKIMSLEKDSELEEHIDQMVWFALVRLLLESVYIYFKNYDKDVKNKIV